MSDYPKIESPCPLRFATLPRDGADFCGQCKRRVHDLSAMDGAQRRAFMASCGEAKVCITYTVPVPRSRAAALRLGVGLAAAIAAAPVLASDPLATPLQSPVDGATLPAAAPNVICLDDVDDDATTIEFIEVTGGTVTRADAVQWVDGESLLRELPRADADAFLDAEGVAFGPAPDGAPR